MKNTIELESSPHKLTPTNGLVIFAADKEFNDKIGKRFQFMLDTSFQPLQHIRLSGEVIAIPEKPDHTIAYMKDEMWPMAKTVVDGDRLSEKLHSYPPSARTPIVHQALRRSYRPTMYKAKAQYYDTQEVNLKVGDKIYFKYLTISEDNFLGMDSEGRNVYKVEYSQIYCKVKGRKIIPLNGYALVEKAYDDAGFTEVRIEGKKRLVKEKMIMNEKNILVPIVVQIDPARLSQHGWIREISRDLRCERMRDDVEKGDYVAFKSQSDFVNKVEEEEVYVMNEWDIVAKADSKKENWSAVGDMLLVKPTMPSYKGLVTLKPSDMPHVFHGEVMSVGSKIDKFGVGDVVYYNPKSRNVVNEELIAVRASDISITKRK